jgi:hypothetical protein
VPETELADFSRIQKRGGPDGSHIVKDPLMDILDIVGEALTFDQVRRQAINKKLDVDFNKNLRL